MEDHVVQVEVKAIVPTASGCAVFLGYPEKTYVIYMDQAMGQQITMIQSQAPKERPLTHDLIVNLLKGMGAQLQRVVINHTDHGTFYARIIIRMDNELGIKILELDARPSDSIALALETKAPIYTAQSVLDAVVDMTEVLDKIMNQ